MSVKTRTEDAGMSPFDTIELINLFNQKYNIKHRTKTSMFDGINVKDPSSTNDKMELFYEYMNLHNLLINQNESYIDIYEENNIVVPSSEHTVFALVTGKSSEILYTSLSYISLLFFALKDMQNPEKSILKSQIWNIVSI